MKHKNEAKRKNLPLNTPEEAAKFLGVSVRTLANWRSKGFPNIPYTKIGRCIRYKPDDLDSYLARHTFNNQEV